MTVIDHGDEPLGTPAGTGPLGHPAGDGRTWGDPGNSLPGDGTQGAGTTGGAWGDQSDATGSR